MTVHHGKRIAIIQNEFGEGIDHNSNFAYQIELRGVEEAAVFGAQEGNNSFQKWVDLPNGWLCCTVKYSNHYDYHLIEF